MDLILKWDSSLGVRRGIEDALRAAIKSGQLKPGAKLPASRTLAADLNVSRNTVAAVYAQLISEGYLESKVGSSTFVKERNVPASGDSERKRWAQPQFRYDLTPGRADVALFPRKEWARAASAALASAPNAALSYGDPAGSSDLRIALAEYLGRTRGVVSSPENIVICSGFTQAFGLLIPCHPIDRTFVVEDPTLITSRRILARVAGLRVREVAVDHDGIQVDLLSADDATLLITPAHQFPLGVSLSAERRRDTIRWARSNGSYIIEDDYDGEFRYDREPVGALQGLGPERVVYIGSASKSLAPGLRLGWMVVPPALRDRVLGEKALADRHSPILDQLTMARFIQSGAFDRHIRKSRLHYSSRRKLLLSALAGLPFSVSGIDAGLHVMIHLGSADVEDRVVRDAARSGLKLSRLQECVQTAQPHPAIVVGYGTPPQHTYRSALKILRRCLENACSGTA